MGLFRPAGPSIFGNVNTPGRCSLGLAAASSLQSRSRGVGRAIAAASVQFLTSLIEEAGGSNQHCFSVSLALFVSVLFSDLAGGKFLQLAACGVEQMRGTAAVSLESLLLA